MPVTLRQAPMQGRVLRKPKHTFQLKQTPYCIQPFMIAPVLPGETLENLLMQSRCVSDPVSNPLVGWWLEHYFFYVKLRDLDDRDTITAMIVNPAQSLTAIDDVADDVPTYYQGDVGYINWAKKCLVRVVDTWFRDEPDVSSTFELDGLPIAQIKEQSWQDSVTAAAAMTSEDVHVPLIGDLAPGGTEDYVSAAAIEKGIREYQLAQMSGMTQLSYDDWLRTFGIHVAPEEEHRPELVRFLSSWSYPTNTVNPANGAPSSALSWSVSERADKKRFFKEPGFLLGVTVARPKVYLGNQSAYAAMLMNSAWSWLPAVMNDDPNSSLLLTAQGKGPLQNGSDAGGYWTDIKDLLVHGDQFLNFLPDISGDTVDSVVLLPAADLKRRYVATLNEIKALFVSGTAGSAYKVRQDGVVALSIAGRTVDERPTIQTRIV